MRYSLMHKNIVVADIEIDEVIGGITNIYDVFAPNHLPIGVYSKQNGKDVVDRYALNQWFADRCIPKHRMEGLVITSSVIPLSMKMLTSSIMISLRTWEIYCSG